MSFARPHFPRTLLLGAALMPLCAAPAAMAQRASENAVANSDDAFGSQVGTETSGIYNEQDTRGLSPLKAGNARLDGIYFDPVASVSGRTRASYGIRVGLAANDYPFAAPTGIVDSRLRTAGDTFVASLSLTKLQYDGQLQELDFQIPVIRDHLSVYLGVGHALTVTGDGARMPSAALAIKPVIRFGGIEISPFIAPTWLYEFRGRTLFVTSGDLVPPQPKQSNYLGQDWARGLFNAVNAGVTAKVPLTSRLAFRGGLFRSSQIRQRSYSELILFSAPGTQANHVLISDPRQETYSWSGEGQLALRLGDGGRVSHRIIAGFRARNRYTETGGSDRRGFGLIDINGKDPEPEPVFNYGPVNVGRVKQSALMLGYQGKVAGLGHINLGLQRARYRASFVNASTGGVTRSSDDAWLYNASLAIELSPHLEVYVGTQKGLEDSGAAPDSAANRNEQLPTTRSTQYEGGLRWKFGKSSVVASLFQITRPYFSFDAANRFTELGTARYRGAELSLTAHLGRLTALAGAVAMQPRVSGAGVAAGLAGERPAGTPDLYARIDLQYRTDILGGLTPTATFTHTGRRALGSAPVAALGGRQAMLSPYSALDLGLRNRFTLGAVPVSFRATLQNVFDRHGWKVIASNTLQPEEHRRFTMTLAADF